MCTIERVREFLKHYDEGIITASEFESWIFREFVNYLYEHRGVWSFGSVCGTNEGKPPKVKHFRFSVTPYEIKVEEETVLIGWKRNNG